MAGSSRGAKITTGAALMLITSTCLGGAAVNTPGNFICVPSANYQCCGELGYCSCTTSTPVLLWRVTLSNGTVYSFDFFARADNVTDMGNFHAEYYENTNSSTLTFNMTCPETNQANVSCLNGASGKIKNSTLTVPGPSAPAGLAVTFNDNDVILSWEDVSQCTAMYNITLMNGTDNLFEATTDRRQYELYALNLSTGYNYQFNVVSYDAEGRANKSSNSELFSISPPTLNCSAIIISDHTLMVTWMKIADENVRRPNISSLNITHNFTTDGTIRCLQNIPVDSNSYNLTDKMVMRKDGDCYFIEIMVSNKLNLAETSTCMVCGSSKLSVGTATLLLVLIVAVGAIV